MTDREEIAFEAYLRIAQRRESIEAAIQQRFRLLEALKASEDPLWRMAHLIETGAYDEAVVRAFMDGMTRRISHDPQVIFSAFADVYPTYREEIYARALGKGEKS